MTDDLERLIFKRCWAALFLSTELAPRLAANVLDDLLGSPRSLSHLHSLAVQMRQ